MDKKRRSGNKKDCPSCESLQTDQEVQIEGRNFKFTKILNASIYHFYREKLKLIERRTEAVQTISLSAETFGRFLNRVRWNYDDFNKLWRINIIFELWEAARALQNADLIQNIESKVCKMINEKHAGAIYEKARLYQSKLVLNKIKIFLQHRFITAEKMHLYCILTFKDFLSIIEEDLISVDTEDVLLRSIFHWAEHFERKPEASEDDQDQQCRKKRKLEGDAPRKDDELVEDKCSKLSQLLRATRYGLASIECLEELSKHPMCENDEEAKLVITKAINYKLDRNTHGYWPPYAYPRNPRYFRHVGVLADKNQVSFLILESMKFHWSRLPRCPLHNIITNVTVFDNELYVINSTGLESLLFVYRNTEWKFVLDLPNKNLLVVAKTSCIYVIDGTSSSVKCVSPRETPVLYSEIKFPDMMRNPESALDFDKSILIFCSTDSDEKSAVFCLDVPEHKWTDCGHLDCSAKNLVGFRNETNYFILQSDGTVRQVLRNQDDDIVFTMIKRLWSIQSALRGAFIYSDILYVFSNTPMENSCLRGVSGLFWRTEYWYQEQEASNFVQFFMPTNDICRADNISETDSEDEEST
ncbi:kelch-like protein 8 [Biomphalaria glabrata]|nr:kelch-like protein 8 [Biomphalaria glabrata]